MKKKSLTDFFRDEYGKLVRYVRRSIDDTADREAEDIVQDVITHLFDKADLSIPVDNLAAYVYRSVRNKIVDLFRKKKHAPLSLDTVTDAPASPGESSYSLSDVLHDPELDVVATVEKKELYDQLYQAIGRLNEREQAVIIATEFDGQSFAQLAADWDEPIGTLLARKARALKKIRSELIGIFSESVSSLTTQKRKNEKKR